MFEENLTEASTAAPETVLQGEFRISDDPAVMLTTLLGSCIAACFWDPVERIGGMNHFLLPAGGSTSGSNLRFGVNAMELLLNGLVSRGAAKPRLQARLFGGAKMFEKGQNIGQQNMEFARWFLDSEGIELKAACIGGTRGRKIRFWPATGQAQRMFLNDMRERSTPPVDLPGPDRRGRPRAAPHGDVELF